MAVLSGGARRPFAARGDAGFPRHRRAAVAVLLALTLTLIPALGAPAPARAAGATATGTIDGWTAVNGDGRVVIWGGGDVGDLVAAATTRGCPPISVWYFGAPGGAVTYVVGAPAFANAGWTAAVPGPLPRSALYVTCGAPPPPPPAQSVLADNQVVALYGYPGHPAQGLLGAYSAEDAAAEAQRRAAQYDALNGARGVVAAFEPIAVVGQADPGADGLYASRLPTATIQQYVDVAKAHGMLVILDLQLGWADPMTEVQRLEPFLALPFVHLALDPEYMTKARGEAPGQVIGSIDPATVNAVQAYLDGLVTAHDLPPKLLVVHQFLTSMIQPTPTAFADYAGVDVVIDMDGFGGEYAKLTKYATFSLASYAERAGIKLFVDWDTPLMPPSQIEALQPPPDLVIYQ